ncbi:addiction module protein [candidate division KSB1 bacterium]|nr:addiction module protein [candidate division KSB1 bacterium]
MHQVDNIKKEITKLSLQQQTQIAQWIFSSLDDVYESQDEVDVAWRAEIRSRVNDIKTGKIQMIPASEMWKDLLDNYVETS